MVSHLLSLSLICQLSREAPLVLMATLLLGVSIKIVFSPVFLGVTGVLIASGARLELVAVAAGVLVAGGGVPAGIKYIKVTITSIDKNVAIKALFSIFFPFILLDHDHLDEKGGISGSVSPLKNNLGRPRIFPPPPGNIASRKG